MPSRELPAGQYRVLLAHSATMVWRAGLDAKCDWFNETWLGFTGRTFEQELGDGWAEGVHPDDLDRCVSHYLENFAARRSFEMEYRLRRHDGVYRWIFDRGVPYQTESGEFAGFIGSCIDVDERRQIDVAKASFLNMMAHELRTPLTPMLAYAHMFRSYADQGAPPPHDLATKLDAQVMRLVRSIDHLGDAARLQLGRPMPVERTPTDVALIVTAAVRELANQKSIEVTFDPPSAPVVAAVDADQLAKALRHVLDNARKFSPRGGSIVVTLTETDHAVIVTVRDRGIGIPPEDLPHVGRMFFRASNAPGERFGGVGIGLSVVREVMAAHHGHLQIASAGLDAGTVVRLELPRTSSG